MSYTAMKVLFIVKMVRPCFYSIVSSEINNPLKLNQSLLSQRRFSVLTNKVKVGSNKNVIIAMKINFKKAILHK